MVWKQKLYVLVIWVVVSVGGAIGVMRLMPTYAAETLILVDSQKIPDRYVATTVISDVQDRLATLSQEILSSTRLKKIIDDYNLYAEDRAKMGPEEIVDLMRSDVEVKLEKGWSGNRPGAFRIAYQGPNPQIVAAVANRLASLYIDENLKVRELQAEGTSEFLDAQLSDAKKKLDELEAAVSRYKIEHNGELPQQETEISTALAQLQTELQGTQDAISRAQQNRLLLDTQVSTTQASLTALLKVSEVPVRGNDGESAPVVPAAEPIRRSQVLEAQLKLLKERYSDAYPEVRRINAELAEAKATEARSSAPSAVPAAPAPAPKGGSKTAEARTTPPPAAGAESPKAGTPTRTIALSAEGFREAEQLRERIASLQVQSKLSEKEIQDRTAERAKVLAEMNEYQAQLKRLPIREQEMAGLTRDYEISKANYRTLLDKKLSADMATEMERRQKAERFTVLDPAVVPDKPVKPKRPLLMAVASLAGFALGIAVAMGKEWNKNVLLGDWELPAGVPILGWVPEIRIGATVPAPREPRRRTKRKSKARLSVIIASAVLVVLLAATAYVHWRVF
ncbi:MAG TPA: GNVR domain-containing protein [Bryobacteraceae bacterium]|nr:GNVR domain-containing protein [Bryobacteraceae bacterium]